MLRRSEVYVVSESLTATQLARQLPDVLNRVAYRREPFVVVRGKRALAELRPLPVGTRLADLPAVLAALPRLQPEAAEAFATDLDAARADLPAARDPWAP